MSRAEGEAEPSIDGLSPAKRALLELRLSKQDPGQSDAPALSPRAAGEPTPLSFAQQRLWLLDQLHPGLGAYNVGRALRLRGPLDVARSRARAERDRRPPRGAAHGLRAGGRGPDPARSRPLAREASSRTEERRLTRTVLRGFVAEEVRKPFDLGAGRSCVAGSGGSPRPSISSSSPRTTSPPTRALGRSSSPSWRRCYEAQLRGGVRSLPRSRPPVRRLRRLGAGHHE